MGGKKEMKKKIFRNLFCAVAFFAICFGASQVFATADFDLKSPTTSKPYLAVMDFVTSGTTTSTTKIIKNVKEAWCQVDVTSVTGTETLTISAECSLNDSTYGSMSAQWLVKDTNTIDTQFANSGGTESGHLFSVNGLWGTHTVTFGGSYPQTVTGSTTFYKLKFPTECYVKIKALLTNGASSPSSKWRVSFIDADPFGHNPKNP